MPYNREEQLEHAARWLTERAQGSSTPLTADEAEDARERRYGIRVGLIPPEESDA